MFKISKIIFLLLVVSNAQARDLSKSSTFNYIKNWYVENLPNWQRKVTELGEDIKDYNRKSANAFDNADADKYKAQAKEAQKALESFETIQKNAEILKNMKKTEINDAMAKDLIGEFLKKVFFIGDQKKVDEFYPLAKKLIDREADLANEYFVVYTAYPKDVEKTYLDKCLKRPAGKSSREYCLKTKELSFLDDLSQLPYKSLEDFIDNKLLTTNYSTDRDASVSNYLGSYNLSLFGNTGTAGSSESTLQRYFSAPGNIVVNSTEYKDASPDILKKLQKLAKQKHAVINQIFLRKDIAPKLGYVSYPFGFPISNNAKDITGETKKILENFQSGKYEAIKDSNLFMISPKQLEIIGIPAKQNPIKAKDHFPTMPSDMQFRLMYLPNLFNQPGNVKIFDSIE